MLGLLFYNNKELFDSDVSEEEDGGDACYLIDSLDASELFSFSEVVGETPVVELASAS